MPYSEEEWHNKDASVIIILLQVASFLGGQCQLRRLDQILAADPLKHFLIFLCGTVGHLVVKCGDCNTTQVHMTCYWEYKTKQTKENLTNHQLELFYWI